MENPIYILQADERVFASQKNDSMRKTIKNVARVVAIILIICLVLYRMFIGLGSGFLFILYCLRTGRLFYLNKSIAVSSPFEIWFYDDHLIIYREKLYCNRRLSRKKYDMLFYKDIRSCEYRMISGKIIFFGIAEIVWYDYNKDGSLPEHPSYHKKMDGPSYFYTIDGASTDFVTEIENHSPINVVMKDK